MAEEKRNLRELQNNIRITGTLKEVNLEIRPNRKDPSVKQIMGNIIVLVQEPENGRVHEHRVELFAKDSSKLYKGYVTIMNEYKPADVVGLENADRVQVVGNISSNDFVGNDGNLIELNRNRGVFVNRINDKPEMKDEAIAQIEVIVTNIRPLADKEGIETGEYGIDAITVGYNNGVTDLKNIVVGKDLADVITENYEVGSTGLLTFAMNSYVESVEKEQDPFANAEGGFGVQVDISNVVERTVRELRVIGGFPPYLDERAFSEEDIRLARQIREVHLQEVKNNVPSTPPVQQGNNGFGANAASNTQPGANVFDTGDSINISDDDLPF